PKGSVGIWSSLDPVPAQDAVALARRIESLGYAALWAPETFGREPLVFNAFLAAQTTKLVLGTSIASVWMRVATPARAAANALAECSGGRFVLGLGVSHGPMVQGFLQQSYDKPLTKMSQYLDVYNGAPYMGAPAPPAPVLIAALGDKMTAL